MMTIPNETPDLLEDTFSRMYINMLKASRLEPQESRTLALSQIYAAWSDNGSPRGSVLLERAGILQPLANLAQILASRPDMQSAGVEWADLDTRHKVQRLQMVSDFVFTLMGVDSLTAFPQVVAAGPEADRQPCWQQVMKKPARGENSRLDIHPEHMDSFRAAFGEVLRQASYHILGGLLILGQDETGAQESVGNAAFLGTMSNGKAAAAILLVLNATRKGYVPRSESLAFRRQPIECCSRVFANKAWIMFDQSLRVHQTWCRPQLIM